MINRVQIALAPLDDLFLYALGETGDSVIDLYRLIAGEGGG
jgi:hypothetical protein